ncbi:MAG: DUF3800 domain-containing protein [Elusimicrobiota bacterium]|nr:DUF3800 domain-containing protein [Elusimicrobiota bacterium]
MLYLYLDESGDLGFDFVNKKPSAFFTICALAIKGSENDRALTNTVRAVIKRKLFHGANNNIQELKGSGTSLEIKRFFYNKVSRINFNLYAVTLNKNRVYEYLARDKKRIYNYIARLTLERVDFKDAAVRVILTVDKSKSKSEILAFNECIITQIKASLDPLVPLDIYHTLSHESPGLQATDMFAWGISRKYEKGDRAWYDVFKTRLKIDRLYLP